MTIYFPLVNILRVVQIGKDVIFNRAGVHIADSDFLFKWLGSGHEFFPSLKERAPGLTFATVFYYYYHFLLLHALKWNI